ncbi:hypothetical protein C2S53_015793 [Perilla frutescens var. hirtella]|uniref:C2 NT-type domain-containing protein n=1 Tax=Perilla frutescens var. hirtella TaxID=608512 RepID=A0AAD4J6S1_PERFH|nr:hypothetical protein C2S53_015793 [Perilla frutescens var. hirtella]
MDLPIPQTGWDKLFISFIPADTGKPTAKTTKANVRNGSCKWGDPIYETTRLLQDSKSKQYDEKLYKLVVAMGSSRASILGEATINLADYVDASKPTISTFPLHGCNFGTVLHITVQLLTSKTGFREFEQQRELREKGLQSGVDSHGDSASGRIPSSEGVINDQTNKVSARLKLKADATVLSSLEDEVNTNEEYADSATGFDGSSNTSGSLYAEKHDTSSTQELDNVKCTMSGDPYGLSHCQSPSAAKDLSDHQNVAQGSTGSAHGWGSSNSMDNEFAMACEENSRLRGSLELAESSLFNLKLEVSSLQGVSDELGAETQKLSNELSAEISSAEELAKEVYSMKLECLKFKDDIIRLKDLKLSPRLPPIEASDNQVDHLVRNMQLQFSDGISVVEGKIRELHKKTYANPHDGDTKFIHLELEALLNFLLDFKLGNGEVMTLPNALSSERADLKEIREIGQFDSGNGFGLDLCPPESVLQHLSPNPPVSDVVNPLGAIDAMKGQIFDLVRELDEAKVEKEALTRKMDQMECYYEALIHELEENQKRLVGELQLLRNEHSTCLYALSVSKTDVESLREEMDQQMLRFVEERRDLEAINQELERRASTSEAALRRARLNYSIAVDKLQKDLELLSSQVTSMFEANENIIKQALPSQTDSQVGVKLVQNPEDDDATKLTQFQNQNVGLKKRSAGGDVLLEDLKRSVCMQEDLYRKVEEELIEMYSINLNLDIYSKALEQSLCEANAELKTMNGKTSELVEELEISTASQNHLMLSLQKATDEIHTLNEYKSSSIFQCSEMALQNQILEDKLVSVSKENYLLAEKLIEWESTLSELRTCQSKYAACLAENAELSIQLKQEEFENEKLVSEMSHLKEELEVLKAESDELVSSKRNLEENIKFAQDKLAHLLYSYNKQFGILAGSQILDLECADIQDAVLQLEEIQHSVSMRNCQLMEENQNLKGKKASVDVSLSSVRSEILSLKQKFKSGIQDMVTKLDVSNALVDKLQAGIESVANKLHLSSEIEEKFTEQNELLLADFALLEDQMQKLTCRNGHLAQEISNLDSLAEELGRSKLEIAELMHDKQELTLCLMDKSEESMKLSCEVNYLKENLNTLRDELNDESTSRDELERKVQDLTLCLSNDQDKLLELEQQNAELAHVRELASHLELEKSRLTDLLNQKTELMEELEKNKQKLTLCLLDKNEESMKLSCEVNSLKENLKTLRDELNDENASRDELDRKVRDLTLCLSKDQDKLLEFEQQKAELVHIKELASHLELEKSRLAHLLNQQNELMEELKKNSSDRATFESQLSDMHDYSLAADVKLIYVSNHYETLLHELLQKLASSEVCLRDLQKRYHDTESMLNHSFAGEANWRQEKDSLLASLESSRSDLEGSEAQNKLLSESKDEMRDQLEESKGKLRMMESHFSMDSSRQASEVLRLQNMITDVEEEMSNLILSRDELEVLAIVLKSKVHEQTAHITLLEGYKEEVMILRSQFSELSKKLAEQTLKTEEFKNLSVHLKELKDKAEAECVAVREKRENEVPSATVQDSLRIAFIKEQYETTVQELKQKLAVSKKHGEEMLMKLQDSIDEIENRKKSEAVSLKKNEELSTRLSALEAELLLVISEKREKSNAYDRTKAELECALLSLECCKEEKEKLGASLLVFEAEKSHLADELTSVKGQLEDLKSLTNIEKDEYCSEPEVERAQNGSTGDASPVSLKQDDSSYGIQRDISVSILDKENAVPIEPVLTPDDESADQDTAPYLQSNGKTSDVNNEHLGTQKLRSSIEHLHEELEKMKNENTVFNIEHDVDPDFQVTQREITQLHKANEELRSMFPLFDEISSGGNALDRVLALEMELAEALKVKNKSKLQFQSSFLKQHSDEEAVFKSFRDINELIKEMLELKGRHSAVESELREMHDRYSQLSLQFAEVEGERQKLKMTLKNVRASKSAYEALEVDAPMLLVAAQCK